MIADFIPQFGLTGLFTWIYFLGVISQLICITVPETGGYKTKVHLVAAGVMSVSATVQVALLILLANLSLWSLIICILSLLIMASIWVVIILKHNLMKYELGMQSLYFASYLSSLMFVSFIA